MEIIKLNCVACGAPISVSEDTEYLNCASCGSFLTIQRGEGYTALKLVEKVAQVVQESAEATQVEIRRLEISQAINALEMQLNSIQGEIRAYKRVKKSKDKKFKKELSKLHFEEYKRLNKLRQLKKDLVSVSGINPDQDPKSIATQLDLISKEINTLLQAPSKDSNISNSINALSHEQRELNKALYQLRLNNVKKELKSTQLVFEENVDETTIRAQLQIVDEDIRTLQARQRTRESDQVLSELRHKQRLLQTRANELERKRVSSELKSLPHESLKGADLAAVKSQLALVESDISLLERRNRTQVIEQQLSLLKSQKKSLSRYVSKAQNSKVPLKPYHPPRFTFSQSTIIVTVAFILLFLAMSILCNESTKSSSSTSTNVAFLDTESPDLETEYTQEPAPTVEPTHTPTLVPTPRATPDLAEIEKYLSDQDTTITDLTAKGSKISLSVNSTLEVEQSLMKRLRQAELLLYMSVYKIFYQFQDVTSVHAQVNDDVGPVLQSNVTRDSAFAFRIDAFSKPVEEVDVILLYTTALIDRMYLQFESFEILDISIDEALYQPNIWSVKDELDGWLLAEIAKCEIQENRVLLQLSVDYLGNLLKNSDKETIDRETLLDAKLQALDAVYVLFTRFEWIEKIDVSSFYYGKKLVSLSVSREHFNEIGAQAFNKAVGSGKPDLVLEKLIIEP